jgi:small-conductance mechanosensitive channel
VLEQLGIDAQILITIFTNVITITVAGLALAFGLGGRDVARNVLAGYYAREQYHAGDVIVINGDEGVLEGIGTMNAEIRVGDDILIVPNTRLTNTAVKIRELSTGNPQVEEGYEE